MTSRHEDVPASDLFAEGFRHHQAGQLAEAEALYHRLLATDPAHPTALYYLGVAVSQRGDHGLAEVLLNRALAEAPNLVEDTTSHLNVVGLGELVADGPEGYLNIAQGLAHDLSRLAAMRAGLRARLSASPLLKSVQFTRALEAAFREMWSTWCVRGDNNGSSRLA